MLSLQHGIAQGVAPVPDCGWSQGLDWLFFVAASLLPLSLPINSGSVLKFMLCEYCESSVHTVKALS